MLDYTGKVAIVTGGARGIGKAICLTLAKQGADIAITDILEQDGRNSVNEIQKLGRRTLFVKTDLTKKESVDKMAKEVLQTFGKVDILVNNAGWDRIELFITNSPEFWDKVIAINYKHQIYTTRAVLDHMIERKYGRIVNISSDAGRVGSTGEAVYSGCKGALIAFTKTMARELARYGITVNCICPGPAETPLAEEMKQEELGSKIFGAMEKVIPLGRLCAPQDIANAVAFMASDEASYITGQTLSVSGGLTMV